VVLIIRQSCLDGWGKDEPLHFFCWIRISAVLLVILGGEWVQVSWPEPNTACISA
jgi:hypothetical protein